MFVTVFPNFPPRAPLYYRTARADSIQFASITTTFQSWAPRPLPSSWAPRACGLYYWRAGDSSTPQPTQPVTAPMWSRPLTYQPYPLVLGYYGISTGDVQAVDSPVVPAWSARFVAQGRPPIQAGALYYRQQTERDTSAPSSVQPETTHPWRPQTLSAPRFRADLFQVIQSADVSGQNATPADETPQSWAPRSLSPIRPFTGYLFRQDITSDAQPTQSPLELPWRRPITYTPLPLTVRFDSIRGGDVPTPPTPAEATNATWAPRPLSGSKPSPAWPLAFWSPNTDQVEEPTSQFQVSWQYQTNYERLARHFLGRYLQSGVRDGVVVPEPPTFPGYVPAPIRVTQVPAIARWLYRQAPPMDFDQTPELSTYPGYVPRPLWPFMAPRGAYMYYRSDRALDDPLPKPTPTFHGNNAMNYMRRLELLGVRLGMTAV